VIAAKGRMTMTVISRHHEGQALDLRYQAGAWSTSLSSSARIACALRRKPKTMGGHAAGVWLAVTEGRRE
jgi:hypothetical protein